MSDWFSNSGARAWRAAAPDGAARAFHRALPGYAPTPLIDRPSLAGELSVGAVLVKDESSRFGLPAFKVLGASWACTRVAERAPGALFVTATDGNHGRAVARMARLLGRNARVYVPGHMLQRAEDLIVAEGAEVVRVAGDYDVAVRAAADFAAAAPGRALVQDTAWEGYEEIPRWIVEGYETMPAEVDEALGRSPDLVVVPVGVGSLAQAVVTHYRQDGAGMTRVLTVEPDTAAGLLASLSAGSPVHVQTGETVMAGLNCGTVSELAWPVLRAGCDAAVAVSDAAASRAVEDLAALGVSGGPSGAATLAGARAALLEPRRRADLDLPEDAVVVLLSTEGRLA